MNPSETRVMELFRELTAVPRPSGHMGSIGAYLEGFAAERGLRSRKDSAGNILIERPGTGMPIILQGHQDMVANSISEFDFASQPLSISEKDGWVSADGTTLGADDGAGIAIMLCALEDPSLEGIPLECLFTADEEIGLVGASQLPSDWLKGKFMINIDSEDDDEITIGSAGSTDIEAVFSPERSRGCGKICSVSVSGLLGGHSAMEIDSGRANAILIAADFARQIEGARLVSASAGAAPNIIPMRCELRFLCESDPRDLFHSYSEKIRAEYAEADPDISMSLWVSDGCASAWSKEATRSFLDSLLSCPNGPLEFDPHGLKTSSNLAMLSSRGDSLAVISKPRSSDAEALDSLIGKIESAFG
ncbi:MAG: M20/M25/M40 family metallo-hydrolase [Candidatus Methanomethylophilaceae archaeon]|nr:M20/M25/M40 family metallo-hydrolase [Candidatus Methanomethylophilaceae archaeon]